MAYKSLYEVTSSHQSFDFTWSIQFQSFSRKTMKFIIFVFFLVAAAMCVSAEKGGSGSGQGNRDLARDIAESVAKSVANAIHKDVGQDGRSYTYHYNYTYTYKFN